MAVQAAIANQAELARGAFAWANRRGSKHAREDMRSGAR